MSRHPLGCFSFFFLCPYSYYFAYFQEIIGIITKYTWTLPGSCSRRRIAVATFARLSTSISCMYVIFAHNDVPLSEGWRPWRCWCHMRHGTSDAYQWYAFMLGKGRLQLGYLHTIPKTLEWMECSEINHRNDDNDGKKTSMTRDTSKYEKCFSYTTACMVILEWACVLMVFDSKTQRILSYSWLSNTLTHPRLKGHLFEIRACRIPWLRQRLPKIRWNVVMYFQYHFMITSDFSSSFFWVWSTFLPCFYSFHFWN